MDLSLVYHHSQYTDDLINKSLSEIISSNILLSMATLINNHNPWINTVYYAYNKSLDLYFMTPTTTQHVSNLKNNSSTAVSIFNSLQQPTDKKRGLQLLGAWEQADGESLKNGTELYAKRFLWLNNYIKDVKDWESTALKSRIYVIHPNSVKIFDEVIFGPEVWVTVSTK